MGYDVDLKALVLKASKAGVYLSIRIGGYGEIILRGQRNNFRVDSQISFYDLVDRFRFSQDEAFNKAADEIIHKLDEAEEKLIETGGYEQ